MFEKHRSRIHLKLNFMDVIIMHEVEFKDDATAVILRGSPFFGTVPPVFPPKTVEKQGGMLAFFCISSASKLVVFSSILVSFSLPRAPLEPPGPPFFPDGAPGRFFSDF